MGNTINLFMWGYQMHAQISLQLSAKSFFDSIDKELNPNVFFLGVLIDEIPNRHPVCIEPEDIGYSVTNFSEIKKLAKELEKVDEEGQIIHSHPIAQENHNKRIGYKALVEAVKKTLTKIDIHGKTEKFISFPTYIEGYLVLVILELQKDALNKHYSLTKNKILDRYKIYRSFIESSINTFLNECANGLKDPNQAIEIIKSPTDELLRKSAKQFMYSVSQAGENFRGLHGLYEACNTIASLKYEGEEGIGKIAIVKNDHPNIRYTLRLKEPISLHDFRKVRKFLQISNDDSLIISDSALIYGLGEIVGKYNPKEESLFIIKFKSHYKWELSHDNNSLMIVEYGQPNIPKNKIDRTKFYTDLKRVFKGIEKHQIDNLWDITNQAINQKHGTMLVISDNAKEEAIRLGNQCFTLEPTKLSANIVQQITSIDGTVLIDRDSTCHAIGVILDGLATEKGDSSRGARYNTAVRYYEQFGKKHPTVIIIISEDGMINLIPDLKPQIKHSTITEAIEELKTIKKVDKRFNVIMEFLEGIEFYLSSQECQTINQIRKDIESKDKDFDTARIIRKDLNSNKEMNESYFIN